MLTNKKQWLLASDTQSFLPAVATKALPQEKKKDSCVPGYICVGSDTGWTVFVFSHVHNRCEADLEKDTSDVQLVSKTRWLSLYAPTLNYKWVRYNRCCGKLGEPSISSWRVMSIWSGNAQGGKIARGPPWSFLLGKSEGRLREMWEIMDGYDGRIRMQCDLRMTELLQPYGRCVHFGGMDGTGRLGNS